MEIRIERIFNCPNYCIGHLYADGKYICDTIEDTDRGLDDGWPIDKIKKVKVMHQTAIPTGRYNVTINVISPRFSKKDYYRKFCGGRVPRLLNVKGFDGILMHIGVNQFNTSGCVIVGYNTVKGAVTNSTQAFEKLYALMKMNNGNISVEITRKYQVPVK